MLQLLSLPILLLASTSSLQAANAPNSNPRAQSQQITGTVPNSYVVVWKDGANITEHLDWLADHVHNNFVPVIPGEDMPVITPLNVPDDTAIGIQGYTLHAEESFAKTIATHEAVDYVQPDIFHMAFATQKPAPWNLQTISDKPTDNATYAFPDTAGEGRARWGASFVEGGTMFDADGHGTHCAGTVASTTFGVAKKSSVVAVRVLDSKGVGTTASIIQGINYVIAASMKKESNSTTTTPPAKVLKSVISMSLGGSKDFALEHAISSAVNFGIPVVVASGNSGTDVPSCFQSPAGATDAFAVGASDIGDNWASFSSGGPCVRVVAPGVNIESLWIDGTSVNLT
ncbi:serine protease, partial [Blyttiomyces sp. JEL0837]